MSKRLLRAFGPRNDITNVLLIILILLSIFNLLTRASVRQAEADTFRLDDCITTDLNEKPIAYLHVVPHKKLVP